MGDTGSLALGGALGAVAVATHHEFVLVIVGGLFVLEAVSVIVQVFWFKRYGKRIFRMAPIHHHFEHLGWSEPTVVIRFWIISFILALAGLIDAQAQVITAKAFAGKHYAVLGLARSGLATVEALLASGARVTAWDDKDSRKRARTRAAGEGRSPAAAWSPASAGGLDRRLRRQPTSPSSTPSSSPPASPSTATRSPSARARPASRSSAISSCSPGRGRSCRRTRWSGSPAPTASRPPPRWSTTSCRPRACRA